MMDLNIKKSFWQRGAFPQVVGSGSEWTIVSNPWANGTLAAPFDKRTFFFIAYAGWTEIDATLM